MAFSMMLHSGKTLLLSLKFLLFRRSTNAHFVLQVAQFLPSHPHLIVSRASLHVLGHPYNAILRIIGAGSAGEALEMRLDPRHVSIDAWGSAFGEGRSIISLRGRLEREVVVCCPSLFHHSEPDSSSEHTLQWFIFSLVDAFFFFGSLKEEKPSFCVLFLISLTH